jgi:hypothetical protein
MHGGTTGTGFTLPGVTSDSRVSMFYGAMNGARAVSDLASSTGSQERWTRSTH